MFEYIYVKMSWIISI